MKLQFTKILLILLIIGNLPIYASVKIDSLKTLLNTEKDTDRAKILFEIGEAYNEQENYNKALDYYKKSIEANNDIKIIAATYNKTGAIYKKLENYDKAIDSYTKAIEICHKSGDRKELSKGLNNLGIIYQRIEEYEPSIDCFLESFQIKKESRDTIGMAKVLNNIGVLCTLLDDYPKALEYFKQSLLYKSTLKDFTGIGKNLNNIGIVYKNMQQYDSALYYFHGALEVKQQLKDKKGITSTLHNIGQAYSHIENYQKALEYYSDVLHITRKINNPSDLSNTHNNLANTYTNLKDYKKAKLHLDTANTLATFSNDLDEILNNHWFSSQLYVAQNKYKDAYKHLSLYDDIKDSLFEIEGQESVILANARFKYEQKEQEISFNEEKKIQKLKTTYIITAIILLFISILFFTLYWNKKKSNKALLIEKEKAQESDRLKSAFLANMSHEIRTPMNAILGFTDLLKDNEISNGEKNTYVNIIEDGGQRMLSIINDLIDISKIDSGQTKITVTSINIKDQILSVHKLLANEANNKGIELKIKVDDIKTNVITDAEKVQAVLINLVKNAIKFTTNGYIEIGFCKKAETVEFYIKDTGPGIKIDKHEQIFERFVQAENHYIQEGTGLGLSISKAYIEMLGGRIWFETVVNKGSTFFFTIPHTYQSL